MKEILVTISYCILLFVNASGQSNSTPGLSVITADSLASGNYKDVFTSFFKLAVDDITGPQKSVSFTSNPYAIMAKGNPALTVDTNYNKYHVLRNINFDVGLNLDSNYTLKGFSLGLKYSLLNKRDVTVSKGFIEEGTKNSQLSILRDAFDSLASIDTTISDSMNQEFENWMNKKAISFTLLNPHLQTVIRQLNATYHLGKVDTSLTQHPELSFRDQALAAYNDLKDSWQRKPLWTISGKSIFLPLTGSNTPSITSVTVATEFLWAFNSPNASVSMEMDILATDSMVSNNTITAQNISRNTFAFEPGVNFVVKSKNNGKSFFEFKLSGTYTHVFSNPLISQNVDSSTINAIFRVRIINDTWVPLTLNIDSHGHVYGSLGIKLNFNALASVVKREY